MICRLFLRGILGVSTTCANKMWLDIGVPLKNQFLGVLLRHVFTKKTLHAFLTRPFMDGRLKRTTTFIDLIEFGSVGGKI